MCYRSAKNTICRFSSSQAFCLQGSVLVSVQMIHDSFGTLNEIGVTPFWKEQVAAFSSKTQQKSSHTELSLSIPCILGLYYPYIYFLPYIKILYFFAIHKATFHQF